MIVGAPKEIKGHEYRVGLLPVGVEELVRAGHRVLVQCNAGVGSGISDADRAGAELSPALEKQYLERLLEQKGLNTDETWSSILEHEGSVAHLEGLTEDEKAIFKTAFELDQRWVIELAADRTPEICQSQSINVFLPGDVDKWDLHMLHWSAWEQGCKSLYYLRSKSVQRAAFAGAAVAAEQPEVEAAARAGRSVRPAGNLS